MALTEAIRVRDEYRESLDGSTNEVEQVVGSKRQMMDNSDDGADDESEIKSTTVVKRSSKRVAAVSKTNATVTSSRVAKQSQSKGGKKMALK